MTPEMKSRMAVYYATQVIEASIHDGDPGDDGDNEITGAGRQAVTFAETDPGTVETDVVSWDIDADTTLVAIGLWDTGGEYLDTVQVNVAFVAAGTYATAIRHVEKDDDDA